MLSLGGILVILYSVNSMVTPSHPWAMRRTVPVILPALAVGVGLLLANVQLPNTWHFAIPNPLTWTKRLVPFLGVGLAALAVALVGVESAPLWTHLEHHNFYQQLTAVDKLIPENALVLVPDGDVGSGFAAPLELLFDKPVLCLHLPLSTDDQQIADTIIKTAIEQGRPVILAVTDQGMNWYPSQWQLTSIGMGVISTPSLSLSTGRPPTANDRSTQVFTLDLYQLSTPESADIATTYPFTVPIAAGSYPYLRSGLYSAGTAADGSAFRWTDGQAVVNIPWSSEQQADQAALALVCTAQVGETQQCSFAAGYDRDKRHRNGKDRALHNRNHLDHCAVTEPPRVLDRRARNRDPKRYLESLRRFGIGRYTRAGSNGQCHPAC